jgi:hypothetical protein
MRRNFAGTLFYSFFVLVSPLPSSRQRRTLHASFESDRFWRESWAEVLGKRNMNAAGQIAVTLAALIGFGRLFLADEGDSHRLSGLLILAGFVGKIALSI